MNEQNIKEIENKRKKYCTTYYVLLSLIPITTIISIVLMKLEIIKITREIIPIIILILFNPLTLFLLTLTIAVNYYTKVSTKYNRILQEQINNSMITTSIINQQNQIGFDYSKGIAREILESTRVIYMGNNYQTSNLIFGLYNNVQFNSARIVMKNIINNKEDKIFDGVYFIFKFNRSLFTNIRITQNGFDKVYWNVSYNNLYQSPYKKFADEFTTYVEKIEYMEHTLKDDFIKPLYTLTKKINKQTKSKVQYVLSNGYMYIAINNPTLFDYKITKKINEDIVNKYNENYLKIVEYVVEILELDK